MKKLILISILLITSVFSFGQTIHEQSIDNSIRVYGHIEIDDSYIRAKVGMFDTIWSGGIGIVIDTIGGTVDIIGGNLVIEQNAITVGDNITINSSGISVNDGTEPFSLGGISVTDGTIVLGTTAFESDIAGRLKFENDSLYVYTDGSDWVNLSAGGGGGGVSISDVQSEIEDSLNAFRSDAIDIETADISISGSWTFGEDVEINAYIKANNIPRSVFAYGAVGDGVTDDYAAIQACLDIGAGTVLMGNDRSDVFMVSKLLSPLSDTDIQIEATLKAMASDSSMLTQDVIEGDTIIHLADVSLFSVGQWLVITDPFNPTNSVDSAGYLYSNCTLTGYRGSSGQIETIWEDGDSLEIHDPSYYPVLVSEGGYAGTVQGCMQLTNVSNVTIRGNGIIDGNKDNQLFARGIKSDGAEQQEGQGGLIIYHCDNIKVDGLTLQDSKIHNVVLTSDGVNTSNDNITLSNLISRRAGEKNYLIRFTKNSSFYNLVADSSQCEDGFTMYSGCYDNTVNMLRSRDNYRNDILLNLVENTELNNIKALGSRADYGFKNFGINTTINNLYTNGIIEVGAQYSGYGLTMNNVTIEDVTATRIFYISDNFKEGTISNLIFRNCNGIAIDQIGDPAQNWKITGGGVYRHTGTIYSLNNSDIDFVNFYPNWTTLDPEYVPLNDSTKWQWRADMGRTIDGDTIITSWVDQIAGYDAVQATANKHPHAQADSNFIRFDDDEWLAVASPATAQNIPNEDFTVSGMFSVANVTGLHYICGKYTGASDYWTIYLSNAILYFNSNDGGAIFNISYPALSANTDYIFVLSIDRDGTPELFINGAPVTPTITTNTTGAISVTSAYTIGNRSTASSASYTFEGKIYWIQYDSKLQDNEWKYQFYRYLDNWNDGF